MISFRHQSASNRWDLELNSLLLTRYTTLFYDDQYIRTSRAGWRKKKEFYALKYALLVPVCDAMCMFNSRNTLRAPTTTTGPWIFGLMEQRQQVCWSPEADQALAFNLKFLQSIKFVFSEVQAGDGDGEMDEHNYSVPLIESRCEASAGLNDDRFNGNTTLRTIFRHKFWDFVRISSSGRDSLWSGRHFWLQRAVPRDSNLERWSAS